MTTQHPSSKPQWLIPAAAISALLLVIFFALGFIGGPDKTEPGTMSVKGQALPAGTKTFQVSQQIAANALSWQGSVRSRVVARLAPKLNARILEIKVNPGDKVNKGDVIARLDDRDLQAAYAAASAALVAAQAQAGQANAEEKRTSDLYEKQAATRQNYDAVVAQARAARAMIGQAAGAAQQAKVMLGENVLYAPFDGVIGERLREPGDMGLPNGAIVTLYKPDDLRLETSIASHCLTRLAIGQIVNVRLDTPAREIVGTVDEIAPEIDPQTHTRSIKIKLPTVAGLQQGQYGWLSLSCQADRKTLLIPVSAVLHYGQLQAVKVVEDGRLHTRHIRTGKQYGEQVEVLSGLHDGETILADSGLAL